MTDQEILAYCLRKPGAYLDQPFGPESVCVKAQGHIFASLMLQKPWLSLKCEPAYGLMMRQRYPDTVRRGYHCPPIQQPYNNTITLDGTVDDTTLLEMIDHSYARNQRKMTKAERAALNEQTTRNA